MDALAYVAPCLLNVSTDKDLATCIRCYYVRCSTAPKKKKINESSFKFIVKVSYNIIIYNTLILTK